MMHVVLREPKSGKKHVFEVIDKKGSQASAKDSCARTGDLSIVVCITLFREKNSNG